MRPGYPAKFAGVRRRPVELLVCWGLRPVEMFMRLGVGALRPVESFMRLGVDVGPSGRPGYPCAL